MALTEAAIAMIGEMRELARWEAELMTDLAETRAKKGEIVGALDRLIRVLPVGERVGLRAEIARIDAPLRRTRRHGSLTANKIEAALTFLATAEETFTTAQMQEWMEAQGVTTHKNDAAAILHRRVKEGMAERLRRGLYRSIKSHPAVARRRMRLVGV